MAMNLCTGVEPRSSEAVDGSRIPVNY